MICVLSIEAMVKFCRSQSPASHVGIAVGLGNVVFFSQQYQCTMVKTQSLIQLGYFSVIQLGDFMGYDYDNFSQPHIGNPKLFIFSIYYHFTYHQNHHQICWGFLKIPFWSFWQPQSFSCRGSCSPKFPFWGVPGPPPQRGAEATKMADF